MSYVRFCAGNTMPCARVIMFHRGLSINFQVEVADVSNILLPPNSCSIAETVSRPLYQRLTVNNGLYSKHSFARGYQGEILQCSPRTSLNGPGTMRT